MALFDVFKKKKEGKKEVKKQEKAKAKAEPQKKVVEKKPLPPKQPKKILGEAYKVLKSPHVTEKASDLVEQNQYVFKVDLGANKIMVANEVKKTYKVKVLNVNIINVPRRARKVGKTTGFKSGFKKAIVTLAPGQTIEAKNI